MESSVALQALGESYRNEARNLDELLEHCRQRRGAAMRHGRSAEAFRLERLIEMHRQQRDDLRQLSVWLCRYYEGAGAAEAFASTKGEEAA